MIALWNKKDLEHPANNIWITKKNDIDVEAFRLSVRKIIEDLKSQEALHVEAAILSRVIYRMKSKFRNDKGLKNMEKVNRALLNYLEIDLLKEYTDLINYVEVERSVVNLPTKQMLQYVLVRTQGFAKLMCRIENVAKSSAQAFNVRLSLGHAWPITIVPYAIVSRIWYLSRYLTKRCCTWYDTIFKHVAEFKLIGPRWLPENYDLPKSLETWLDVPWINEAIDGVPLNEDGKESIFGLIKALVEDENDPKMRDENSVQTSKTPKNSLAEYQTIPKTEEKADQDGKESYAAKRDVAHFSDDVGVSIDRESFQSELRAELSGRQERTRSKENSKRKQEGVPISAKSLRNDGETPPANKKRKKLSKAGKRKLEETRGSDEINSGPMEMETEQRIETKLESDRGGKTLSKIDISNRLGNASCDLDRESVCLKPGIKKLHDNLLKIINQGRPSGMDEKQWKLLNRRVQRYVTQLKTDDAPRDREQKLLLKKLRLQVKNLVA